MLILHKKQKYFVYAKYTLISSKSIYIYSTSKIKKPTKFMISRFNCNFLGQF